MSPETMNQIIQAFIAWLERCPMVNTLLILMLLDVISGICVAVLQQNLSSTISWRGMMKKVLTLLVLGVAMTIQPFATGLPIPLGNGVAFCFICTEAISVLENAALAGVKLPQPLLAVLSRLSEPGNSRLPAGSTEVKVEVTSSSPESSAHSNKKSIHTVQPS